jgi:hypothetical protein
MKDDNDEPLTFETLAAATARVLEKQQCYSHRTSDRCGDHAAEQKRKQHKQYVARRLRELAAFEARARRK